MKKRKSLLASALCVLAISVSGCGNAIPELTESQELAITDYAVDLVLKYDENYQSRLVELSKEELAEEEEVVSTSQPEESVETDSEEKVPEVQVGQDISSNLSVEEVLGWKDMCELSYLDFQTTDSYETSSEEQGYVSVEASEGNKLLVTHYSLTNVSVEEQHINMIAKDAVFTISVGSEPPKKCQLTLLENDLSTYFGDIPVNASVEVVLIAEMAGDLLENVTSLQLNVENEERIATIQLD